MTASISAWPRTRKAAATVFKESWKCIVNHHKSLDCHTNAPLALPISVENTVRFQDNRHGILCSHCVSSRDSEGGTTLRVFLFNN